MQRALFSAVITILLTSCAPIPSTSDPVNAQEIVNSISYAKDARSGLCYGVVTTDALIYSTGSINITEVPCDSVKNLLGR